MNTSYLRIVSERWPPSPNKTLVVAVAHLIRDRYVYYSTRLTIF